MGGKGSSAENVLKDNAGIKALNQYAQGAQDPRLNDVLMDYSSGNSSLSDALSSLTSNSADEYQRRIARDTAKLNALKPPSPEGKTWQEQLIAQKQYEVQKKQLQDALKRHTAEKQKQATTAKARRDQIFTDPLTGTQAATEQVQNNPLLSGMFGEGGLQDRILAEEQELASRGYSLQPEDHEAYGQAMGNIARQFGQEEQSIANALAARGLASAPSGAAMVAYSGAMGNKNERLRQAQTDIAQKRMEMNLQRLNNARNFAMQSNQLGQAAIQDQFNRNLMGIQDYKGTMKDSAAAGQMLQGQANTEFSQHQATKGPSLGDIVGGGLGSLAGNVLGSGGQALGGTVGKKVGELVKF